MLQWYLYALFVFGLLLILMFIYSKIIKSKYPDVSEYKQREERLFRLYQNIEDLMDGFEEYVEEVKQSLTEEINLKRNQPEEVNEEKISKVDVVIPEVDVREAYDNVSNKSESSGNDKDSRLSSKMDIINELIKDGMSVDDIARELDVGKGEIKLIMQLLNKKTKV